MINVKRNTLTYRLVDRIFRHPNRSICIYFWQAVWSYMCLLLVGLFVVSFISIPFFFYYGIDPNLRESIWWFAYATPGMLGWMALIIFGLGGLLYGLMWCVVEILRHTISGVEFTTKDSVVVEYVKAKKEKVCPRINFVDE